jgi:hypothetical protein
LSIVLPHRSCLLQVLELLQMIGVLVFIILSKHQFAEMIPIGHPSTVLNSLELGCNRSLEVQGREPRLHHRVHSINLEKHDTDHATILDYHCRVPKTRGTHNQRLRKTKRYPQTRRAKTANETPRPHFDLYEARSMGRLDHVLTHMRLARQGTSTIGNL